MESHSNVKMPVLTKLYCCFVILGLINTISTVFSTRGYFIFFYAFFLVPPILQLIALYSRNNRLLLIGFYGAVLLHAIEYIFGGYLYGFDRLFSTFGSSIVGYFISVFIWWSYLQFSQKAALYFNVKRVTSWKSASSNASSFLNTPAAPMDKNFELSSSLTVSEPNFSKSDVTHSQNYPADPVIAVSQPSTSQNFNHNSPTAPSRHSIRNSKSIIILLIILLLLSVSLNLYQISINKNNRAELAESLQSISALQKEISRQEQIVSNQKIKYKDLEDKYNSLQDSNEKTLYPLIKLSFSAYYILDNDTEYYHFYNCPLVQSYDGNYWVHNPEYCEFLGYSPCPLCT